MQGRADALVTDLRTPNPLYTRSGRQVRAHLSHAARGDENDDDWTAGAAVVMMTSLMNLIRRTG